MATYKAHNYSQMILLPISLEDQLLPGTLEWAIHKLVEHRVDTSIFDENYANDDTGAPAYPPKILLKIVLFAYTRGLVSSRQIERACREHITFLALACGMAPDHSTIAAFVSAMQAEIVSIFRDILLVCHEQGLLGGTLFALDGLKLPSNAAKEWSGRCADLRKKQQKLEATLATVLERHQQTDAAEETSVSPEQSRREAQIKRLTHQAERIEAFLEANEPKIGKAGKEIQSNVTDNDSAQMMTSHGMIQGYNGQALVDDKHQVIGHAEAFGNGQDYGHVAPMLTGAQAHCTAIGMDEHALKGTQFTADSNYHSEENLRACQEAKVDAYIPDTHFRKRDPRCASHARHHPTRAGQLTQDDCTYLPEEDSYRCPAGKRLRMHARRHRIRDGIYRRYRAEASDCHACVFRERCLQTTQTKRKSLAIFVEQAVPSLSQQMIAKIDTPEARSIYDRRLAIVEPVCANIRTQKRLDRFTLRGQAKVNVQWVLYCLVHNMEKILHYGAIAA